MLLRHFVGILLKVFVFSIFFALITAATNLGLQLLWVTTDHRDLHVVKHVGQVFWLAALHLGEGRGKCRGIDLVWWLLSAHLLV